MPAIWGGRAGIVRIEVIVAGDAGQARRRAARRGGDCATIRAMATFPGPETSITHILVVSDLARSRSWYLDVLGATEYREYGGSSVVLSFAGAWLLLVTGGGPTPD